jgi:pimeloyl-ACP methyl ester carboxylesterase
MLPGHSLDSDIYLEVVQYLGANIEAVLVDNRGSGRSDAPRASFSIETMAADVSSLMLGIGLERAVIVGHSMGGFVAQTLALHSPELAAGLVLVGTAATGVPQLLRTSPKAKAARELRTGALQDIVRANIVAGVAPAFLNDHGDEVSRFVDARVALPPRGRGVEGQRRAVSGFDVRDRLWEISCPVLVCHGEIDEIVPLERGKELARGLANASLLAWPGVGHFPQLENPKALAQAISDFCASL